MKTTAEAIGDVLTAIQGQQTTEKPINTQVWAKWFGFETFNEPDLERMFRESVLFIRDMELGRPARWLSLLGTSGAGKTLLAKGIHRWVMRSRKFHSRIDASSNEIVYPEEFVYWPDVANDLQQGNGRGYVSDLAKRRHFVCLDEIGLVKDSTGFVTNQLAIMLGQRVNKWTVITANLSLKEIATQLDARIASRMIRDGSKVVCVNVQDFWVRKNKTITPHNP